MMRFIHKKNVDLHKKKHRIRFIVTVLAVVSFCAGLYLLLLVATPSLPIISPIKPIDIKTLPGPKEDRVYIPKIGVNVALAVGGPEALDRGSWHRFPERGDPVAGGNFIVSAHRFSIGLTPGKTREHSPFYDINKLVTGDQIIVDFKGKRYGYQVTNHTEVKPTQTEIEAPLSPGEAPHMTLYTCTLKGESDGREVYYAKPLGEVSNGAVSVQ